MFTIILILFIYAINPTYNLYTKVHFIDIILGLINSKL